MLRRSLYVIAVILLVASFFINGTACTFCWEGALAAAALAFLLDFTHDEKVNSELRDMLDKR